MRSRIKELRNFLKLSQSDFGKQIGVSTTTISEMETGTTTILDRTIITICLKFNVNEEWLRTGKGQMFNIIDKKFNEFFEIYNSLSTPLQEFLLKVANDLLEIQDKL